MGDVRYRPNGLLNVVKELDVSSSDTDQYPWQALRLEDTLDPASW